MKLVAKTAKNLQWCMDYLNVPLYLRELSTYALYDLLQQYGIRATVDVIEDWQKKYGS